jgi:hypothetical protein
MGSHRAAVSAFGKFFTDLIAGTHRQRRCPGKRFAQKWAGQMILPMAKTIIG